MSHTKSCRLCVSKCIEPKSLYEPNGQPNALHGIIEKYFHPTILNIHKYKQFNGICRQCWRQVWKFCNFQKSIHEAQLKLAAELPEQVMLTDVLADSANDSTFDDLINVETQTKFIQQIPEDCTQLGPDDQTIDELIEQDLITIVPLKNKGKRDASNVIVVEEVTHDYHKREKAMQDAHVYEVLPNDVVIKDEIELFDVYSDYQESGDEEKPSVSRYTMALSPPMADRSTLREDQLPSKPCTPYKCELCEIYTKSKEGLELHVQLSHFDALNTESAKCRLCHSFLKDKHSLYLHYQRQHQLTVYKYCCPHCLRLFNNAEVYKVHLNKNHGNEEKSQHSFNKKSRMKAVRRAKPAAAPTNMGFECTFCPRSFSQLNELTAHHTHRHSSEMEN